jgi:hypothetical protein
VAGSQWVTGTQPDARIGDDFWRQIGERTGDDLRLVQAGRHLPESLGRKIYKCLLKSM